MQSLVIRNVDLTGQDIKSKYAEGNGHWYTRDLGAVGVYRLYFATFNVQDLRLETSYV